MTCIDPASSEFEALTRREQALIYATYFKWSIKAIAEEFGVSESTAGFWVNPDMYDRYLEQKRARRRTESGRAKEIAYWQSERGRAARDRANEKRRVGYSRSTINLSQEANRP